MKSKKASVIGDHLLHNEKVIKRKSRLFKKTCKKSNESDESDSEMNDNYYNRAKHTICKNPFDDECLDGNRIDQQSKESTQFRSSINNLNLEEIKALAYNNNLIQEGEELAKFSIPKFNLELITQNSNDNNSSSSNKRNSLLGTNNKYNDVALNSGPNYAIESFIDESKLNQLDDEYGRILDLKFDEIKINDDDNDNDDETNNDRFQYYTDNSNINNYFNSFNSYSQFSNNNLMTQNSNGANLEGMLVNNFNRFNNTNRTERTENSFFSSNLGRTQFTSKSQLVIDEAALINFSNYYVNTNNFKSQKSIRESDKDIIYYDYPDNNDNFSNNISRNQDDVNISLFNKLESKLTYLTNFNNNNNTSNTNKKSQILNTTSNDNAKVNTNTINNDDINKENNEDRNKDNSTSLNKLFLDNCVKSFSVKKRFKLI